MKSIITISLSIICLNLCAQRLYKGEKAVAVTVGFEDSTEFKQHANYSAYFVGISYSKVNANKTRWIFGLNCDIKHFRVFDDFANSNAYIADAALYIPIISDYKKNWILSFGLGGNVGYEDMNTKSKQLFFAVKGKSMENKLIVGAFGGIENEVYLSNKIIWIVDCKLRYFKGETTISNYTWNFGTGIKFRLRN